MVKLETVLLFHLFDNFETHGPLAGYNVRVVIAVNVRKRLVLG